MFSILHLQEYLKNHTVDLATLSKMSLGVAKGLAHLHSDLGKPCIAHRDLNTRNILVKADLSCCICDLGLAVVPKRTENRSLSEAGKLDVQEFCHRKCIYQKNIAKGALNKTFRWDYCCYYALDTWRFALQWRTAGWLNGHFIYNF